jgi:hypothetical protein
VNPIDIVILAAFFMGVFKGFYTGLAGPLLNILKWVLIVIFTLKCWYLGVVALKAIGLGNMASPVLAAIITGILAITAFRLFVSMVGYYVNSRSMRWVNRFLGLLFWAFCFVLATAWALNVLNNLGLISAYLAQSSLYQLVQPLPVITINAVVPALTEIWNFLQTLINSL